MIIAVAGPDAAGKSRLCAALARHPELGYQPVSLVSTIEGLKRLTTVEAFCAAPQAERLRVLLQACCAVVDVDAEDRVLLADGYWMKHLASEIAMGAPPDLVHASVAPLPDLVLTVYLRVPPHVTWQRRTPDEVNDYECGLRGEVSERAFLRHQTALNGVLDAWAVERRWHPVDATRGFDDVLADSVAACASVLAAGSRT